MKNTFIILIISLFIIGCSNQKPTQLDTVTKYINAKNAGNFSVIKNLINDNITIIEGDYVMPYNHDSFYEVFKWDSIFQPTYRIVDMEQKNNQLFASVTLTSIRNTFLKNKNMTCQYEFSFESGKISNIKSLDCTGVDWQVWEKERDRLVNWVNSNHPELNGFINDMTDTGALNYLKAIEYYNNSKEE